MIKYLNKFDPKKATEDQCRDFINDSKNNVQYYKMSEIFGGKRTYLLKDVIVNKTIDKELKKQDIKDAIKYIENYDTVLKKLKAEYEKVNKEFQDQVDLKQMISPKGDSLEELRKTAFNHKLSLKSIADTTYYQSLFTKYSIELDQAKKIMVKAAHYNPRNLKESYIVQEYIDSLYEFNETCEDLDL